MNDQDKQNFMQLMLLIGENYKSEFSKVKIQLWWDLLKEYDYKSIHDATYKHFTDSSYEPKPADIIKHLKPDYDDIFYRMVKGGKSQNDIEYQTWRNVGYACKTQLSEDVARKRFKAEYIRQVEISKRPKAPTTHRIEHEKPVNIKDKMVDENLDKYKGKSPEEIKEMLASFKINKV